MSERRTRSVRPKRPFSKAWRSASVDVRMRRVAKARLAPCPPSLGKLHPERWARWRFAHPTSLGRKSSIVKQPRTRLRILAEPSRPSDEVTCPSRGRGRRECRVPAAPAASYAKMKKAYEHSRHRFVETIRHSLRDGLRLIRDLPGVHDLLVTVIGAMREALSPTWHQPRGARTTRLRRPRWHRSSDDAAASIASRSTFRDDRP